VAVTFMSSMIGLSCNARRQAYQFMI